MRCVHKTKWIDIQHITHLTTIVYKLHNEDKAVTKSTFSLVVISTIDLEFIIFTATIQPNVFLFQLSPDIKTNILFDAESTLYGSMPNISRFSHTLSLYIYFFIPSFKQLEQPLDCFSGVLLYYWPPWTHNRSQNTYSFYLLIITQQCLPKWHHLNIWISNREFTSSKNPLYQRDSLGEHFKAFFCMSNNL